MTRISVRAVELPKRTLAEVLRLVAALPSPVVLSGRWDAGPWRVVASARTDSRGRYRLSIKLRRRGILHLRITPPDGDDHLFVLHVV